METGKFITTEDTENTEEKQNKWGYQSGPGPEMATDNRFQLSKVSPLLPFLRALRVLRGSSSSVLAE